MITRIDGECYQSRSCILHADGHETDTKYKACQKSSGTVSCVFKAEQFYLTIKVAFSWFFSQLSKTIIQYAHVLIIISLYLDLSLIIGMTIPKKESKKQFEISKDPEKEKVKLLIEEPLEHENATRELTEEIEEDKKMRERGETEKDGNDVKEFCIGYEDNIIFKDKEPKGHANDMKEMSIENEDERHTNNVEKTCIGNEEKDKCVKEIRTDPEEIVENHHETILKNNKYGKDHFLHYKTENCEWAAEDSERLDKHCYNAVDIASHDNLTISSLGSSLDVLDFSNNSEEETSKNNVTNSKHAILCERKEMKLPSPHFVTKKEVSKCLQYTNQANEKSVEIMTDTSLQKNEKAKEYASSSQRNRSESLLFDNLRGDGFQIKPQRASVYMMVSQQPRQSNGIDRSPIPSLHPNACGDIPWFWLREEKWRLHTFARYPTNTAKSAILLAKDGFAYNGSGRGSDDTVICFFCCMSKSGWQVDDNIHLVHQKTSPNCSMVTGIECNNIPLVPPANLSFNTSRKNCHGAESRKSGAEASNQSQEHASSMPTTHNESSDHQQSQAQSSSSFGTASFSNPSVSQNNNFKDSHQPSVDNASYVIVTSSDTTSSFPDVPSDDSRNEHTALPPSGDSRNEHTALPQSSSTGQEQSFSSDNSGNGNRPSQQPNPASNRPNTGMPSNSNTSATSSNMTTESTDSDERTGSGGSSQRPHAANQSNVQPNAATATYDDLGIITDRPKRFEYAVRIKRLETFANWPQNHHLTKEDLADAGFYFAGYGDCARCFYCGGGLRNWEKEDDVWVEHARWFPKCAFIRQQLGMVFVQTVQQLAANNDVISFKDVTDKMGVTVSAFQLDSKISALKRDPAVVIVMKMGYREDDVLRAATTVKETGSFLSADTLFDQLEEIEAPRNVSIVDDDSFSVGSDASRDEETMSDLREKNNQYRQQTICKICMDKEVAVVFLPCGHFITCTDCAAAMKDCPLCRKPVRGIVRAFIG